MSPNDPADQLAREIAGGPGPLVRLRQGVVTAMASPTVSVVLAGSLVEIPGVAYLSHYSPTVGDTVWLVQNGPDLLIVGSTVRAGTGWLTAATNAECTTAGFISQANWSLTQMIWRIQGSFAVMRWLVSRTTSTLNVPADGNVTNEAVFNVPPEMVPVTSQGLYQYNTGRLTAYAVSSAGNVTIAAAAPGADILNGAGLSGGGIYLID